MQSWRVLVRELSIDEVTVEVAYADVFVVLREGDAEPGPSDWEATVRTDLRHRLPPGRHELRAVTADDVELHGHALLRFSDGHQHLFRGDGTLGGSAGVVT